MSFYRGGSITVKAGSKAVSGLGTVFMSQVKPGDILMIAGSLAIVETVEANTALTLALAWSGVSGIDITAYVIAHTGDGWSSTKSASETILSVLDKVEALPNAVTADLAGTVDEIVGVRKVGTERRLARIERSALTALTQTTERLIAPSWDILRGKAGEFALQGAEVSAGDTGTHADPVTGGLVQNAGLYSWSLSPYGWRWLDGNAISNKVDKAELQDVVDDIDGALGGWRPVSIVMTQKTYHDRASGAAVANDFFKTVKIALPAGGRDFRVTSKVSGGSMALAVYYDQNDTRIGMEGPGAQGRTDTYVDHILTPPGAARFVALTTLMSQPDVQAAERYVRPVAAELDAAIAGLPAKSSFATLSDTIEESLSGWKTRSVTMTAGIYHDRTGGAEVANSVFKSVKISLVPGQAIRVSSKVSGSAMALAVYYDADGAWLGFEKPGTGGQTDTYVGQRLSPPASARSVALTTLTSQQDVQVEDRVIRAIGEEIDTKLMPAVALSPAYWLGKSIVWFGTSIPAGLGPRGSYPALVAKGLGATLYNEAVAGSAARGGVRSKIASDDPYGWKGTSYTNTAYSLGNTIAEKQYLIDNYGTWKSILGNAPASLSDAEKAKILDCSYENRLVARHLGANRRDLYVFDHGYNDYAKSRDLTTVPTDDPKNRFTFIGAIAMMVDLILNDNPRARIVFVGHYETARNAMVADAQKLVAAAWNYPLIPLWERLGWSQASVTVNGSAKTLTQVWMPDDLHPHSDTTGSAIDLIAATLIPYFRDLR